MALGWVSAKVPNEDSVKKWALYLHQGGRNRQNGDVHFNLADPVRSTFLKFTNPCLLLVQTYFDQIL